MRRSGSATFNAEGIVVRTRNLGDADRIVMLLTPDHGMVGCVAKSARKPKSRTGGKTDLLQHITFSARTGRNDLHQLAQVETLDAHLALQTDLSRLTIAAHMAELAERFSDTGVANAELFALLRDALSHAERVGVGEREDGMQRLKLSVLRLWHDFNVLKVCGFAPQVDYCVRTGETVGPGDHMWSPAEGGVVSMASDRTIREAAARQGRTVSPLFDAPEGSLTVLRRIDAAGFDWATVEAGVSMSQWDAVGWAEMLLDTLVEALSERGARRTARVSRDMGEMRRRFWVPPTWPEVDNAAEQGG